MPPLAKPGLFGRLLLFFTIVPVADLVLLVWLGQRIHFWPTVGLIVGTAVLGSYLAHREGLSVLARFRARLASGEMPGTELSDGLIILTSGALLLTPGVLTDLVGLLGLLPPSRRLIRRVLAKRFSPNLVVPRGPSPWSPPSGEADAAADIVDAEFEDLPPR